MPSNVNASMAAEEEIGIAGAILKHLTRHPDERGFFLELIRATDPFFAEGFAQLSHSKMFPEVAKAWHIHKTQIDWWYVPIGTLKVGFARSARGQPHARRYQNALSGRRLSTCRAEDSGRRGAWLQSDWRHQPPLLCHLAHLRPRRRGPHPSR